MGRLKFLRRPFCIIGNYIFFTQNIILFHIFKLYDFHFKRIFNIKKEILYTFQLANTKDFYVSMPNIFFALSDLFRYKLNYFFLVPFCNTMINLFYLICNPRVRYRISYTPNYTSHIINILFKTFSDR